MSRFWLSQSRGFVRNLEVITLKVPHVILSLGIKIKQEKVFFNVAIPMGWILSLFVSITYFLIWKTCVNYTNIAAKVKCPDGLPPSSIFTRLEESGDQPQQFRSTNWAMHPLHSTRKKMFQKKIPGKFFDNCIWLTQVQYVPFNLSTFDQIILILVFHDACKICKFFITKALPSCPFFHTY